jgi:hypothetical protein
MRRTAILVLILSLAGCGQFSLNLGGLDTGPLEEEIRAGIERTADGVVIDRVECPRNVRPQAGSVFVCRVHAADGSLGTVEVLQTDDEGGVEWELTDVRAPDDDG